MTTAVELCNSQCASSGAPGPPTDPKLAMVLRTSSVARLTGITASTASGTSARAAV